MIDFKPIELARKEKSKCTYYELYSMKNQRNIQLYSQQCYYQALILEMSHNVTSYCERPYMIGTSSTDTSKVKLIDFIVEYNNSNLLEMQRMNYYGTNMIPALIGQTFLVEENWCLQHGYRYQIITFNESIINGYYLQNTKYLYGLIRRIKSPIYNKYIDLLVCALYSRKVVTILEFMTENNISSYEAYLTVSFGIYRGIISLYLGSGAITLNTEVKLASNESSI